MLSIVIFLQFLRGKGRKKSRVLSRTHFPIRVSLTARLFQKAHVLLFCCIFGYRCTRLDEWWFCKNCLSWQCGWHVFPTILSMKREGLVVGEMQSKRRENLHFNNQSLPKFSSSLSPPPPPPAQGPSFFLQRIKNLLLRLLLRFVDEECWSEANDSNIYHFSLLK